MLRSIILILIVSGILFLGFRHREASEIDKIKSLQTTDEQSDELLKLLERVGPVEAQEQMLRSGLPFTGETHLLIHTVGDFIYDRYGPDGLPYCRDYFLSACYHGFIINTLADHGIKGMAEVMDKCVAAPPGVSAQCAHASGHGFVAWHDYDLVKGAEMCDELGARVENFPYFNCYDGVFMENVWGVHDGKPSEKRWVKSDDFFYPCNDSRIPEKYLKGCWSNQATLVYQYLHGNLEKTAKFCDGVPEAEYRDTCYNNLYRQIHPLTNGKPDRALSLCEKTGDNRQEECILTNMQAYWSVGDREVPYEICRILSGPIQSDCFERLIGMVNYHYAEEPREKELYCDKILSKTYQDSCKK